MRRGNGGGWLLDDKKDLIGISLGSDFTSEHEWGIKGIKRGFGISTDERIYGIARRLITKVPGENIYFKETETYSILIFGDRRWLVEYLKKTGKHPMIDRELKPYCDDLGTAWDEQSFGIYVKDKKGKQLLKELHKTILAGNVAIWLGGGGVFQNAGLTIGVVNHIPEDSLKTMYDGDKQNYKTKVAGEKTGIYEILKKADKGYYACSPGSVLKSTSRGEIKTAYDVMYFLNPMEQNKYNFGWFTVEQLKEWAEDKGPIIKKAGE